MKIEVVDTSKKVQEVIVNMSGPGNVQVDLTVSSQDGLVAPARLASVSQGSMLIPFEFLRRAVRVVERRLGLPELEQEVGED